MPNSKSNNRSHEKANKQQKQWPYVNGDASDHNFLEERLSQLARSLVHRPGLSLLDSEGYSGRTIRSLIKATDRSTTGRCRWGVTRLSQRIWIGERGEGRP